MNEVENIKNNRVLIISISFVVFGIGAMFLIDYFQKKELRNNGIRATATVIARYCEISDKGDTSGYSMRLKVIENTSTSSKNNVGGLLNAFVNKESFNKYEESSVVKVVYNEENKDRARLVEEIE